MHDPRQGIAGDGAVVRSVAAAADRQTRVVACVQRGRKWPQPEEQYEEDGEGASHLTNMLHEVRKVGTCDQ